MSLTTCHFLCDFTLLMNLVLIISSSGNILPLLFLNHWLSLCSSETSEIAPFKGHLFFKCLCSLNLCLESSLHSMCSLYSLTLMALLLPPEHSSSVVFFSPGFSSENLYLDVKYLRDDCQSFKMFFFFLIKECKI